MKDARALGPDASSIHRKLSQRLVRLELLLLLLLRLPDELRLEPV
jgi:hypothetical protein